MSSIWSRLINLAGNITGTLGVANGGTGLTSGTSGGVLGYTAAGTAASSALLAANGVVIGGGAGATPTAITAGTNGQLLVGVTSGAPAFGSTVSAATTFSGGVVFGGGGTNLNNYQTGTSTVAVSGCTSSPNVTCTATRIGNLVTLVFSGPGALTKSGAGVLSVSGLVPSFARPTNVISWINYSRASGNLSGYDILTNGTLEQATTAFGNYLDANTVGWDLNLPISYLIQ